MTTLRLDAGQGVSTAIHREDVLASQPLPATEATMKTHDITDDVSDIDIAIQPRHANRQRIQDRKQMLRIKRVGHRITREDR